jgi:hypothetical protein
MNSAYPCSICQEGGHKASKCPELHQPEKVSGGGGGGHDHDDDEKIEPVMIPVISSVTEDVIALKVPLV